MTKLQYDLIVVGGGHAGCEASSAAARMGLRTLLLTMDMTKLADMSATGDRGVAKGQIVRAGHFFWRQTGVCRLHVRQFRRLNRSKGRSGVESACAMRQIPFFGAMAAGVENTTNPIFGRTPRRALSTGGTQVCGLPVCGHVWGWSSLPAVILTSGTFRR
ncbi:MAG: FAD-dependent oxidoreductase [Alistipes sp.]